MTNLYVQKLDGNGNTVSLFTIGNNTTFQPKYDAPLSPMPLPQNNDEANILIKVSGNTTTITQSWVIADQKTNNGNPGGANSGFIAVTATDTSLNVLTAWDQVNFWDKYMVPIGITDRYSIVIADSCTLGNATNPNTATGYYQPTFTNTYYKKPGSITDFTPTMSNSAPVTFDSNFTFMAGNVISAYETNTPSYPLNFSASQGSSSGQINLSWTAPNDVAGGLSSTGYHIYRRTGLQSYPTSPSLSESSSTTSVTDTGLTSNIKYYYIIYAVNSNGEGMGSIEVSAVAK